MRRRTPVSLSWLWTYLLDGRFSYASHVLGQVDLDQVLLDLGGRVSFMTYVLRGLRSQVVISTSVSQGHRNANSCTYGRTRIFFLGLLGGFQASVLRVGVFSPIGVFLCGLGEVLSAMYGIANVGGGACVFEVYVLRRAIGLDGTLCGDARVVVRDGDGAVLLFYSLAGLIRTYTRNVPLFIVRLVFVSRGQDVRLTLGAMTLLEYTSRFHARDFRRDGLYARLLLGLLGQFNSRRT